MLIQSKKTYKSAVYWVVACIAIHSFATQCELERHTDNHDLADDLFVTAGLSSACDDSKHIPSIGQIQVSVRLARGKEKREQLKAAWMAENGLHEFEDDK